MLPVYGSNLKPLIVMKKKEGKEIWKRPTALLFNLRL
jgi:hypothetical protein